MSILIIIKIISNWAEVFGCFFFFPYSSMIENQLLILIVGITSIVIIISIVFFFLRSRRRTRLNQREDTIQELYLKFQNQLNQFYYQLKNTQENQRQLNEMLQILESKIEQIISSSSTRYHRYQPSETENFELLSRLEQPSNQSLIQELVTTYNAALIDQNERINFRDNFHTVRIGVQNAMERRRDSNQEPVFQTASDGDYYAIDLGNQYDNKFAIVPRFDLILQESNFVPGAIGYVFECSGFNPNMRYRHFTLKKPAYFTQSQGENWKLIERGEILLSEGE